MLTTKLPGYILVVAQSARMLAQQSANAGFIPLAIDCFGDKDTRTYAREYQKVASLAEHDLMPAVDYFIGRYPVIGMVYGSGFERHVGSLRRVGSCLNILGNYPDTFAHLHKKQEFFSLLSALHIPYPEVSFHHPDDEVGWLVKPMQGHGGVGIKHYHKAQAAEPLTYWQKYQEGVPHSVLFLADGKRSQVIGFNRQWTTALNAENEFCFAGIINHTELTEVQKAQISHWMTLLVPELSLQGLNSMDFIQAGQISYVLEINPRPPASMQLYDADLFARHIKACQGELLAYQPKQLGFAGYQVVYAPQAVHIPDGVEWPEGVVDIPHPGSNIGAGQPICSMITTSNEPDKVLACLQKQPNTYHQPYYKVTTWNTAPASIN